jgi:hypothetical protein
MENQMKLTSETLSVLKNFASINQGIEFKKGNTIRTMSSGKTVLAKATLKDEFPQDFCVYDLNQFLSVHSMFDNTEIEFDSNHVIFKSGAKKSTSQPEVSAVSTRTAEPQAALTAVAASAKSSCCGG